MLILEQEVINLDVLWTLGWCLCFSRTFLEILFVLFGCPVILVSVCNRESSAVAM